jgi:hypothetical protein
MRTKIEKYAEALTSLNSKNVILTCDENEVINIDWKDTTPIDMATIDAKVAELDTEYDNNQYQRDRAVEYPSIVNQLDDIYHNGIDGWKAIIKTTKDKYPKE